LNSNKKEKNLSGPVNDSRSLFGYTKSSKKTAWYQRAHDARIAKDSGKTEEESDSVRINDRHVSFYYEMDDDYGDIVIDLKKTALLVVDMQHVFITRPTIDNPTEREKQDVMRWEPFYRKIDDVVVPNNKRLLEAFRTKGIEGLFCQNTVPQERRQRPIF